MNPDNLRTQILVVDDSPANVVVLVDVLRSPSHVEADMGRLS